MQKEKDPLTELLEGKYGEVIIRGSVQLENNEIIVSEEIFKKIQNFIRNKE